jgi:hypothetical protein
MESGELKPAANTHFSSAELPAVAVGRTMLKARGKFS